MKFIFSNNKQNYIVKFHEVHLYCKNNNKLQYLFIHPIYKYKKKVFMVLFYFSPLYKFEAHIHYYHP
jgi:hypothetical protein